MFYKRLAIRLAVAYGFAFVEINNIYRGAKTVYSYYFTTVYGLFVYDIYSFTFFPLVLPICSQIIFVQRFLRGPLDHFNQMYRLPLCQFSIY